MIAPLSLGVFSFAAMTFVTLAFRFWRLPQAPPRPLAALVAACALSFSLSLLLQLDLAPEWAARALALPAGLAVVTALLPPLIAAAAANGKRPVLLRAFTVSSLLFAGLSFASGHDWVQVPPLENYRAAPFLAAGVLGAATRPPAPLAASLAGLCVASLATMTPWGNSPWVSVLPDYALLVFLAAAVYVQERLLFFDVILQRGAYFAAGVLVLAVAAADWSARASMGWLLLWALAPQLAELSRRGVDRYILRRRFSAEESERYFQERTQSAASEAALREALERTLSEIFAANVRIADPQEARPPALQAPLGGGEILLAEPRSPGQPFWSEDARLLDRLARSAGLMLDAARLRDSEAALRLLSSRAELRALRAQVNPHFLFNSLNAIAGLIPSNPTLADATIEKLAEVFRFSLRRSAQEWVTVREEVDFLSAYLDVEGARFGARLQSSVEAERGVEGAWVPAMLLQPLVENAILHGASQATTGGQVRFRVSARGPRLRAEVEDNGPGFPPQYSVDAADSTHALRNISERLDKLFGAHAKLEWESVPGLTRVSCEMPLLFEEPKR